MTRRWSLRARFVVFATACLLPLLAVVVYLLDQGLERNRRQLLDIEYAVADVVNQGLEDTLAENINALDNLAEEEAIANLDTSQVGELLGQYRQARPGITGVFLVNADREGVARASSLDLAPVVNDIAETLDRALIEGQPGVSDRISVGGIEAIVIMHPVWPAPPDETNETTGTTDAAPDRSDAGAAATEAADQPSGQPVGALGVLISTERLQQSVIPFASGDTEIAVVAEGQIIIAQGGISNRGDSLAATYSDQITAAISGSSGSFNLEDEAENQRLAIFQPVTFPGAEWAIFVTNLSPSSFGPTRSLLTQGVFVLGAAGLATLVLAVVLGEITARPLRQLTSQVGNLRRGDFNQRIEAVGSGEVRVLSDAFAEMANQLAGQVQGLELTREERERQAEQMRDLLRRTVRLQEDERRRIAAEIHDAVSPLITGALYQARALRLTNGSTAAEERDASLADVGRLLERASDELHDVIFALRPPDLDDIGVVAAIEAYVQTIQRTGLQCRLEVIGQPPALTPEVRLGVYRIVQEALHNVLRHAGADEAVVRLESTEQQLRVTIRDNGAGFDPEAAVRPTSLGLLSMRERAAAIGAGFTIITRTGGGTAIVIERSASGDVSATDLLDRPEIGAGTEPEMHDGHRDPEPAEPVQDVRAQSEVA